MAHLVSVREVDNLEYWLSNGMHIDLDNESQVNSELFQKALSEAHRILPGASSLEDIEIKRLADSVAYLLNPNLIYCEKRNSGFYTVSFRNSPELLVPGFKLDNAFQSDASEYFRCYSGIKNFLPETYQKLSKNIKHDPSFELADVTAFLVRPEDTRTYKYSEKELANFHEALDNQLGSV